MVRRTFVPDCTVLEGRQLLSITTTKFIIKEPGPTDTLVVLATNPAGHQAVGQTSTTTVHNGTKL
jgi:hypothetical protein